VNTSVRSRRWRLVLRQVRLLVWLLAVALLWLAVANRAARAASEPAPLSVAPQVVFPYYSPDNAVQGVYAHHLPPLVTGWVEQARLLSVVTDGFCQRSRTLANVRAQWRATLLAWDAASAPSVGPLLLRRTQREVDFWPIRPTHIERAIDKAPQTLGDMEHVGTVAKGFGAMDWLLTQWTSVAPKGAAPSPNACRYLWLVAQGIQAEAEALQTDLHAWTSKQWGDHPEDTRAAMAEWLNQWLAGLERLRWTQMEKPVSMAHTTGRSPKEKSALFARTEPGDNAASWQAQWGSLVAQGRLGSSQRVHPPQPGRAMVPIEALLLGKGHVVLARRWAQALDAASARMSHLPVAPGEGGGLAHADVLAAASALKRVAALFQSEVAPALDIPLGFSDADGD
jgi:hypothetical protein